MTTTKAPDNQPFEFNLDSFVKGLDCQPFRFHWRDRRWELTHADALDSWDVAKASKQGEEAILREAMGDEQWEEFIKIPLPQGGLKEMLRRYYKHCGIEPGES